MTDPVGRDAVTVGSRLRVARKSLGWTQSELAAVSGVPKLAIKRAEEDHLMTTVVDVVKLCEAMHCNLAAIADPEGCREAVLEGRCRELLRRLQAQDDEILESHCDERYEFMAMGYFVYSDSREGALALLYARLSYTYEQAISSGALCGQ